MIIMLRQSRVTWLNLIKEIMITYKEYFCLRMPQIYVYLDGQIVGVIEYCKNRNCLIYSDILSGDVLHEAKSLAEMKEILEN